MIRSLKASLSVGAALLVAAALLSAGAARAADDIASAPFWVKGANWASFRGGYVKSTASTAPEGNVGVGMTYRHMLSNHFSIGGTVDVNFLGKVGAASRTEIPLGLEYLWHVRWKSAGIHPYLGMGFAGYYEKVRRSGDDRSTFSPGGHLRTGLELPVDARSLIGFDVKVASVSSDYTGNDPVFGPDAPSSGRVDVKITYSRLW